jgi:hypothetical protein
MIDFVDETPGLSRRKQGFETPTGRQYDQSLSCFDFVSFKFPSQRTPSLARHGSGEADSIVGAHLVLVVGKIRIPAS